MTFWKVFKTDHDFVMKQGLRVHLKSLRTLREIDNHVHRSKLPKLRLLITEFIKEVSPLLPNPCHHQDYDRSIFPRSAWFRRMPPEDVRR